MYSAVVVVGGFTRFSVGVLNFPEANHPFGFRLAGDVPTTKREVADFIREKEKGSPDTLGTNRPMSRKTKSVPRVRPIR